MTSPFSLKALLRGIFIAAGLFPWLLPLLGESGKAFRNVFIPLCHQLPERTISLWRTPMPVCSRCAGIYLGLALGALLPSIPWLEKRGKGAVFIAALLMVVDVVTQDLGLHGSNHIPRLGTGLLAGASASAFLRACLTPFNRTAQKI